jgi:hypothetical protein
MDDEEKWEVRNVHARRGRHGTLRILFRIPPWWAQTEVVLEPGVPYTCRDGFETAALKQFEVK